MTTRKDTRTDLVKELEALPRTNSLDFIIREAKEGEFHDYKNKKYACGKVALVEYLQAESRIHPDNETAQTLIKICKRVMDGEFDETADEEDKEEMRKFLPSVMWPVFGLDKK